MEIYGVKILNGPADWQIIQRDEAGMGSFKVEGTWGTVESDFSIQGRLVDENINAPVTRELDWQDAVVDRARQRFTLTMNRIPAGGLYRLETRLRRPAASDRRAMRGDCVHHLGVGDIFVIAGQSNASGTGKGAVTDGPVMGVHLFGNDEKWKLAVHPVEDATGTLHPVTVTGVFHGHSPWLAFGRRIWVKTGIPVGLIPTALGGSAILQWVTDVGEPGPLFLNMMDMLKKAGGQAAGVLWYQGESDVIIGATDQYARRFRELVSLWRKTMGQKNLPIITGQMNGYQIIQKKPCDWNRMREIQRRLAHELDRVYLAVTVDCPLSDEIHNSAASNVAIGERYADLALTHLYHHPVLAEFPEPEKLWFAEADRRCIEVSFINLSGDWTPNTGEGAFRVDDQEGVVPVERVELCATRNVRIYLGRPAKGQAVLQAGYGVQPLPGPRDDGGRCLTPFSLPVADQ